MHGAARETIAAFNRLRENTRAVDGHAYACFNDNTEYWVCRRYAGNMRRTASLEFPRLAALVMPTNDSFASDCIIAPTYTVIANDLCDDCAEVLSELLFGGEEQYELREELNKRLIWRSMRDGSLAYATGTDRLISVQRRF